MRIVAPLTLVALAILGTFVLLRERPGRHAAPAAVAGVDESAGADSTLEAVPGERGRTAHMDQAPTNEQAPRGLPAEPPSLEHCFSIEDETARRQCLREASAGASAEDLGGWVSGLLCEALTRGEAPPNVPAALYDLVETVGLDVALALITESDGACGHWRLREQLRAQMLAVYSAEQLAAQLELDGVGAFFGDAASLAGIDLLGALLETNPDPAIGTLLRAGARGEYEATASQSHQAYVTLLPHLSAAQRISVCKSILDSDLLMSGVSETPYGSTLLRSSMDDSAWEECDHADILQLIHGMMDHPSLGPSSTAYLMMHRDERPPGCSELDWNELVQHAAAMADHYGLETD
ncbi:MAG: hypothetical protein AAGA20_06785 [Planctomycetota bacterium]